MIEKLKFSNWTKFSFLKWLQKSEVIHQFSPLSQLAD